MAESCPLPVADPETGLKVLKGLARDRSLLTALEIMRQEVGPAFQINLPGFEPAVFVGPESNRQIMVSRQAHFRWRGPSDPVTKLLRHGLLVEDGESHACLRAQLEPVLQKGHITRHVPAMGLYTDRVLVGWTDGSVRDMLVEMRRLALLIFVGALLGDDFGPDMERLWQPILRSIKYISPGLWIIWPGMPRFGYKKALARIDEYLFGLIRQRRQQLVNEKPAQDEQPAADLLTQLIRNPDMNDDLIRDQILTMLIAGHDTSTAMLAWTLHLLSEHPEVMAQARAEVDAVVGQATTITLDHVNRLDYLDTVIKETLRLYPPIHVGNRFVAEDTNIAGYQLHAGMRVMASIYLAHRDERYWDEPEQFRPERFGPGAERRPPFTYVPFGGGPRACVGAAFAQIEAKVALGRILQQFELFSTGRKVHPYMGATLEPHPGVFLRVQRR
jgi:cytochrome P450